MMDAVAPIVSAVRGRRAEAHAAAYEMVRLPDRNDKTFPVFMRREPGPNGHGAVRRSVLGGPVPVETRLIRLFPVALFHAYFRRPPHRRSGVRPARCGRPRCFACFLLNGGLSAARADVRPVSSWRPPTPSIYLGAEGLRRYGRAVDLQPSPAAAIVFGLLGLAVAVVGGLLLWRESRSVATCCRRPPWASLAVVGVLARRSRRHDGRPVFPDAAQIASAVPGGPPMGVGRFLGGFPPWGTGQAEFYRPRPSGGRLRCFGGDFGVDAGGAGPAWAAAWSARAARICGRRSPPPTWRGPANRPLGIGRHAARTGSLLGRHWSGSLPTTPAPYWTDLIRLPLLQVVFLGHRHRGRRAARGTASSGRGGTTPGTGDPTARYRG